jgi:hypothetical protein
MTKGAHVHSDAITALWVLAVVVVGVNAIRLGSAYCVSKGGTAAKVGATVGGLVHWG